MTTRYYFVEPLDVLMIRGNKSFGGTGQHGEAVMPPWPSLFAGAFRSALLGEDGERLARFVAIGSDRNLAEEEKRRSIHEVLGAELFACLGTPANPGAFRLSWLSLARRTEDDGIEPIIPLPADLAAFSGQELPPVSALKPAPLPAGCAASTELPYTACLRIGKQAKPDGGCWLDGTGLMAYLAGDVPETTRKTSDLYKRETRLGIALDSDSRTAETGALYTTEAISFCDGAGFLVGIDGADFLPESGLLRLGGDGKGARYWRRDDFTKPAAPLPESDGRFRLILQTPGLFSSPQAAEGAGWLPNGIVRENGGYWLRGPGYSARLVCAAIPRHEVISGWDLAIWQPKTAQRVAPAGSVYWFEGFQGDARKLAEAGLWSDPCEDASRRAEGFNRIHIAAWK